LAVILILSVIKISNDRIKTSEIKEDINEMMVPPEVSAGEESPSDEWMVPPEVSAGEESPSDKSSAGSSESYDDTPNFDTGLDEESSPSDEWMVPPDL